MLLSLPLVGLGFIALNAGLRFTVYAVPILALSIGYLIIYIADRYIKMAKFRVLFSAIATIAIVTPNIIHVVDYRVPSVFYKR